MNIGVQISLRTCFQFCLHLYPEEGFLDNTVNPVFNLRGNYHNAFHSGCAILHPSQWCTMSVGICTQSCWTHLRPIDCSPPGSSVHRILQARILEGVAIPFSRGSSRPRDRTCISCISCSGRWVLYQLSHQGSPTRAPTESILN